jgi:hypothetical protein
MTRQQNRVNKMFAVRLRRLAAYGHKVGSAYGKPPFFILSLR